MDWMGYDLYCKTLHHKWIFLQAKRDPFKCQYISTVDKLACKVGNMELHEYFHSIDDIKYFDNRNEMENMYDPTTNMTSCSVIILDYFNDTEYNTPEILNINENIFKLRTIVGVDSGIKWDGITYSRYGGVQFQKWWIDKKMQRIPTKLEQYPTTLPHYERYVLVFVKSVQQGHENFDKICYEYLQYLGGQNKCQCVHHNLPLIRSTIQSRHCRCGRKEFYTCCEFNCDTVMCKQCVDQQNSLDGITYVSSDSNNHNMENIENTEQAQDNESESSYIF